MTNRQPWHTHWRQWRAWLQQDITHVATWPRWARWSLLAVVAVVVQGVGWVLWSQSHYTEWQRAQAQHAQAMPSEAARHSDNEFQLAHAADSQAQTTQAQALLDTLPLSQEVARLWDDVERLAIAQQVQATRQDMSVSALSPAHSEIATAGESAAGLAAWPNETMAWQAQGDYVALMAWIRAISLAQPWTQVVTMDLMAELQGSQVSMQLVLQTPRQLLASEQWPTVAASSAANAPVLSDVWQLASHTVPQLDVTPAFEGLDSPMGLSRWVHLLPQDWAVLWQRARPTHAQQIPLDQLRWLGGLVNHDRAMAWLQADNEVVTVQPGDPIGLGINRVEHIEADRVVIMQLLPDEQYGWRTQEWVVSAFPVSP